MEKEAQLLAKIEPKPENLIRGLQLLQAVRGRISDDGVKAAAEYFHRPASDVEGVIAFYPQFTRSRGETNVIELCNGRACGKKKIELQNAVKEYVQGRFSLKTVDCLGVCAQAPAMRVNGRLYTRLDRKKMAEILAPYKENAE